MCLHIGTFPRYFMPGTCFAYYKKVYRNWKQKQKDRFPLLFHLCFTGWSLYQNSNNGLAISWVKTRRCQANFALYNHLSALLLSVRSLLFSKWIQQEKDRCSLVTTSESWDFQTHEPNLPLPMSSQTVFLPPQNLSSSPFNWLRS